MKNVSRKIFISLGLIALFSVGFVASNSTSTAYAQTTSGGGQAVSATTPIDYQPISPLPFWKGGGTIGQYISGAYDFLIAICFALAIIVIVINGFQYVLTAIGGKKAEAKETITRAVIGILIAVGSYALLYTINPELVQPTLQLSPLAAPNASPSNTGGAISPSPTTGGSTASTNSNAPQVGPTADPTSSTGLEPSN